MKVLSTDGLTKLIQLIKSAFISVDDTVSTNTVTLADVATTGDYEDLINKPSAVTESTVSGWGFTKNIGTVTSVNNTQPDNNGNVSITIPDTSNLANTSLTNVTDTGYIKMAGAGMPSNTFVNLTVGASGTSYTAPANGWFTYSTTNTSTQNNFTYLNNETAKLTSYSMAVAGVVANGFIPAKKGDLVSLGYFNSVIAVFRFIYAQGSESEAS